jgi:hypothetical protein
MTKFKPSDTVVVSLKGRDHPGEVIAVSRGYIMARIHIDPVWDYGKTTWLDPEPTVCVKDSDVRHADTVTPPKLSPQ